MALVGNILLGTGAAPGMSSIASAYAESAASSRIPWVALEYSGQAITAISGSAIGVQGGGGGDTSQCMPISGMTAYQTVSSISSWTADMSSISSKQDALTFGYSGEYISSINGSAIIDTQGGGGGVTPDEVSAIASAYADEKLDRTASSNFQPTGNYAYESSLSSKLDASASSDFAPSGDYAYNSSMSSKQDALTFGYDDGKISAINGSAIAGGGGATGDYVEKSAVPIGIGSSINSTNTSIALGSFATADRMSVAIGRIVSATGTSVAIGGRASAGQASFSFGWYSTAYDEAVAMGRNTEATHLSTALGYVSKATNSSVAIGMYLSAGNNNTVFGRYNSTSNSANTVFSIGDGDANTARHNLLEIDKDGEITMFSSTSDTVGTGIMSSIRAISSWSSDFVPKSAVSGWSAQIATLSSTLASLSATVTEMTSNKYTLSAGAGISITNDSTNKRTIIATV